MDQLSHDPGALLERLVRTLGYRGKLPQLWLRPAAIILGIALALALGVVAVAAAQMVIQNLLPSSNAAANQAATLEPFTLSGAIERIEPSEWVVEGVPIAIDTQTIIDQSPSIGASVTIQGVAELDGTLRARTITVAGQAASAATAIPSAVDVPTVIAAEPTAAAPATTIAPTQPPPTEAPIAPSPVPAIITNDPFTGLRIVIDAGMSDGRIDREDGASLLKRLDQAQTAATEGKGDQLYDRLNDMQQKTYQQLNEGKIDAGIGQQVLDGIATIAVTYGIELPSPDTGKEDNKGKGKGTGD